MQGLIGKKVGMTRIFNKESGEIVPVTIISVEPNVVHQVKTEEKDGYSAVQLGFEAIAERKVNSPELGHFKKLGTTPTRLIKEFPLEGADAGLSAGQTVDVGIFEGIKFVNVAGTSKGRGFAGCIKRHKFQRGRETHGNKNHREPGSIGSNSYPARVFPGQKMPGHMGAHRVTTKRLTLVGVDKEKCLMYIRGAVPGARNGIVYINRTIG